MFTNQQIADAKKSASYSDNDHHHEHDDRIRIAYEWLDAQTKTKGPTAKRWALKHVIENWAGRYVSQSDVEVAAHMHPEITGSYPKYNISARLIRPSSSRLTGIAEAHTQHYKETDTKLYARDEQ
ncbi:hypothetical protein IFT66_00090 [Rhizobium sp. CFBP 13726]|uniref:hypothetical protein n=1 Tax=Rhizobium sp. CFBP 13726 TaxID=2775296 RepID=UPI001783B51A|nr:hypothetical protein [Rhizobium sp. CFBP 13726]MBD8649472.1 hypothetical protein [Rhizobium sp. CFBP 13726]